MLVKKILENATGLVNQEKRIFTILNTRFYNDISIF